jgi:hypothetical protein
VLLLLHFRGVFLLGRVSRVSIASFFVSLLRQAANARRRPRFLNGTALLQQ